MNVVEAVFNIIKEIWNGLFGLTSPFFGLTFKQIFGGLFVVIISIHILWDLLGLGAAAIDTATNIGRRAAHRSRSYSRSSSGSSSGSSIPSHSVRSGGGQSEGFVRNYRTGSSLGKQNYIPKRSKAR